MGSMDRLVGCETSALECWPIYIRVCSPADDSHGLSVWTPLWGPPGAMPIMGKVGIASRSFYPPCLSYTPSSCDPLVGPM